MDKPTGFITILKIFLEFLSKCYETNYGFQCCAMYMDKKTVKFATCYRKANFSKFYRNISNKLFEVVV